jgi:hypothetical protein
MLLSTVISTDASKLLQLNISKKGWLKVICEEGF